MEVQARLTEGECKGKGGDRLRLRRNASQDSQEMAKKGSGEKERGSGEKDGGSGGQGRERGGAGKRPCVRFFGICSLALARQAAM